MKSNQPNLDWLENPEVFQVNRLDPHSDHTYFMHTPDDLVLSLNGTWKVNVAPNPAARPADFYQPDFDDTSFASIQVPGNLQMQGFAPNHYTNTIYPWDGLDDLRPPFISKERNLTASYRTTFDLPANYQDYSQILTFDGVETAFYCWVNGQFVGYAEDSFTPSSFDITSLVKEKGNVLAVEVYQRSSASWLEDQDMWRFTGIFRDVKIEMRPDIHIIDVKTTQDVDLEKKTALLKAELKNKVLIPGQIQAALYYQDQLIAQQEAPAGTENTFEFQVEDVKLWSAEDPQLYELRFNVLAQDHLLEQAWLNIGFRRFEMDHGIMKLNGRRIVFRGVNRHEFDPTTGRTVSRQVMEQDAAFMKKNNVNAVRCSHYPNSTPWYNLADTYGFYLVDETNMETHGSWQKLGVVEPSWNIPGSLPQWKEAVLDRAANMYERDKNHPSILLWSLGNESFGGTNIQAMHDYFHEVDPSRLVHYEGVAWCDGFDEASDVVSRMYHKPAEVEEYVAGNPDKPYVLCEFSHAMGNSLGNFQEYVDLEKYPSYQGGFIWDFVDQAIACEEDGRTVYKYGGDFGDYPNDGNFSGDGILFADRSKTPKAQEMKQVYRYVNMQPTATGVLIENNYLFDDLSNMVFRYEQKKDNEVLVQGEFVQSMEPGSSLEVEIPWQNCQNPGIYTRTVSLHTRKDTPWAKAGHELAYGQSVQVKKGRKPICHEQLKVVKGDGNVGVSAPGFSAYFCYQKGLISIKYDGVEMLKGAVKPDFMRALTDNDEAAGYGQQAGIWIAATMYEKITGWQMEEKDGFFAITYTYEVPFVNETVHLKYTVTPCCTIKAELSMPAGKNRPMLQAFGLRVGMPTSFDQVTFFGKGELDTYLDRDHGKFDVYSSPVQDQYTSYLRPQESGSHMGVWWMDLTNQEGQGLRFEAENEPLQASALPYAPEELQIASHFEELPAPHHTFVRLLSEQMGVGGDDTWGAPVHEEYHLDADAPHFCSFTIRKA